MTEKNDTALMRPRDVLLAGVLLTRLPLPPVPEGGFARSACAVWAYPLIGAGLAATSCLPWILTPVLPATVVAGLSLVVLALMTGGLHEDGLADTADGLWGGHTPARRMEIMRDSRIGSYGVLALILVTGLRWMSLVAAGPGGLFAGIVLGRAVLPGLMTIGPFARPDGLAKSVGMPKPVHSVLALLIGTVTTMWLIGIGHGLACCLAAVAVAWGLLRLARAKIGGITGDILGATEQIAQLAVLLVYAALAAP